MNAPLSIDSIVQRSDAVMSNEVDGDLVMMDVERGQYYGLDKIGTDIWNRLEQPKSVADLCAELRQSYRVDEETCLRDVLKLLEHMRSETLIKLISPD